MVVAVTTRTAGRRPATPWRWYREYMEFSPEKNAGDLPQSPAAVRREWSPVASNCSNCRQMPANSSASRQAASVSRTGRGTGASAGAME